MVDCLDVSDGKAALKSGVFGAAAGDLSPILSAGLCDGTQNTTTPDYDMSKWYALQTAILALPRMDELIADSTSQGGQLPDASQYSGPACPHARCSPATCYKVENLGQVGGSKGEVLGSAIVQIIDGCPAGSAWNYCSPTTETLDLDFNAYSSLYPGKTYSSGNPEHNANLQIRITPSSC
ncbi:MAG: hypothetical protein Q9224_000033 [Gallowayella concinna]